MRKTGLPSRLIVIQLELTMVCCVWYCFVYLLLTLFASHCDRLLVSGCCCWCCCYFCCCCRWTHFITLHWHGKTEKQTKTWPAMWRNININASSMGDDVVPPATIGDMQIVPECGPKTLTISLAVVLAKMPANTYEYDIIAGMNEWMEGVLQLLYRVGLWLGRFGFGLRSEPV